MKRVPLHPPLVAVVLVLLLWTSNVTDVSADMVLAPLLIALVVPVVATALAALLTRDLRRSALVGTVTALLWLLHRPLWTLLPFAVPTGLRVGVSLVAVAATAVWATRLDDDRLASTTRTWNALGLLAVAGLAVAVATTGTLARATPVPAPDVAHASTLPDVVWVVPDRYGSAAALDVRFGVDSTPFEAALVERGFTVAEDARANYPRTVMSLAAQLNLTGLEAPLADLPDGADASVTPLYPLLEDHAVGRLLRDAGYDYVHIGNWWSPTLDAATATEVRTAGRSTEFGRLVERATLGPRIGLQVSDLPLTHRALHEVTNRTALDHLEEEVERLAADTADPPRFVFAHLALPHEPYVFDVDGSRLGRAQDGSEWSTAEAFDRQRQYLDDRLLEIIDSVPPPEDGGPVIMLLADEGPHPAGYRSSSWAWEDAAPRDLVAKLSILAAVRGRGPEPVDLPPGVTGVNVARTFVADALGVDLPPLDDRVFVYPTPDAVHDRIDVTDALDAALRP